MALAPATAAWVVSFWVFLKVDGFKERLCRASWHLLVHSQNEKLIKSLVLTFSS